VILKDDNNINTSEIPDHIKRSESLYDTLKKGGLMMIPIMLLGLIGLIIIIERGIFYGRSQVWKKETIDLFIKNIAKDKFEFREELEEKLKESVIIYRDRMEKGLILLNGVGALSPLLGFLGTVVGMISAFATIAEASTVNAQLVAGGIQIALITTAGGLTIAVPVLASFHFLKHLVQQTLNRANELIQIECSKLPSALSQR